MFAPEPINLFLHALEGCRRAASAPSGVISAERRKTNALFLEDSNPLTAGVIAQLHRLIYTVCSESVRSTTGLIYTYCRFLEQLGGRMSGRLSIPLSILLLRHRSLVYSQDLQYMLA